MPSTTPAPPRRLADRALAAFWPLWAAILALPVLAFLLGAWWSWREVEMDARARLARSIDMLHEQALRAFEVQEAVLAAMEARLAGLDWPEIAASEEVHAFLAGLDARTPSTSRIALVDPQGRLVQTSGQVVPSPGIDVSDRDYVRALRAGQAGTFVGEVVTTRPSGVQAFPVARPRLGADGRPDGGLLLGSFPVEGVRQVYAAVAESPGDIVALARLDGAVLARYPALAPGSAVDEAGPLRLLRDGALEEGIAWLPGEGGARLVGLRRVGGYPVVVIHAPDPQVLRQAWMQRLAIIGAICAGAATLLALLTAAARRAARGAQEALARAAAEADLARGEAEARATAERRLRQSERSAALGQVAAGVAHDMNNLVQSVLAAARLLDRRAMQPVEVRRLAAMVGDAAARGHVLAHRMLEFAHPPSRPEDRCDLARALAGLEALLAGMMGGGVRLHLSVAPGLPPAAANGGEFETVLVNLAANARDAMPQGGELRLEVAADESGPPGIRRAGPWVRVRVADTGIGMTEEVLRLAGEPFFTTRPAGQGSGLGLLRARHFAERAAGAMTIRSAPGRGTVVTLWLPVAEEAVGRGGTEPAPGALAGAASGGSAAAAPEGPPAAGARAA